MKSNTVLMMSVVLVSYSLLLSACNQGAKTSSDPKPNKTKEPAVSKDDTAEAKFSLLQSSTAKVYLGEKLSTLKTIASTNGKKVSVFQFSGVTCISCKEESPAVQAGFLGLTGVGRYVVFPNQIGEYKPEDYKGFTSKYAKNAAYVVDHNLTVLNEVRRDDTQFFGMYVILKPDGTAIILNEEGAAQEVVEKVKEVL
ncbi:MAG: hypothetical protein NT027_01905 [Proteobacteria bacterium]|nr:hypothetical protein [Pseudomonadota bacterium]